LFGRAAARDRGSPWHNEAMANELGDFDARRVAAAEAERGEP
jgi:hypothetical protein